jgi:hypothetical protein
MVLDKAVTPPAALGRWSCRSMALMTGISKASRRPAPVGGQRHQAALVANFQIVQGQAF